MTAFEVPPRMNTARNFACCMFTSAMDKACGRRAREPSEHRPRNQAGTAGIIVVEQIADHLTTSEEPGDRTPATIKHPSLVVEFQAAKRKSNAARDRVADEGPRVELLRPV